MTNTGIASNPAQQVGDILCLSGVVRVVPQPEKIDIPDYLPASVHRAFEEGCTIIKASPSMAITSFRKALELALKEHSPEIEAWKLEKRIDKMAAAGKLTNELRDWAHHLRLDGNDATHEGEDGLDSEQIKSNAISARELARFILIYLFTLPGQIKAARPAD